MFVTHPQHEFPVPDGLANPGTQHWRLVEFVLHTPWFLVTVATQPARNISTLTHTWCIAWERDLAHVLTTTDRKRILELVCMMPAWSSKSGHWSSREVREVWLSHTADDGDIMWFVDSEGNRFDGGLKEEQTEKAAERRLLLRLEPKASPLHPNKVREHRSKT